MTVPDLINGLFEAGGGILCWLNVIQLFKDKEVKGITLSAATFFGFFSAWNMYYYPHLDQYLSLMGATFLLIGNWMWIFLAMYYKYKKV